MHVASSAFTNVPAVAGCRITAALAEFGAARATQGAATQINRSVHVDQIGAESAARCSQTS